MLTKSGASLGALALLFALSAVSLRLGGAEVDRQEAAIERMLALDLADRDAVQASSGDFGDAAYYSFYPTWNPPSELAFISLGQRDVAPYMLRIRALAIEGQIYETDQLNPELALAGRLDFEFVVAFLLPLFAVFLLHDLVSSEREANRHALLSAAAGTGTRLWVPRIAVRVAALMLCVLTPFWIAAVVNGVGAGSAVAASLVVLANLGFWVTLTLVLAWRAWPSSVIAASLVTSWLLLSLVVPLFGKLLIDESVPSTDGADIALLQREAVNDAWDLPKSVTMARFFRSHPEWADTSPVTQAFHWKWYYAFQQVGDEAAAEPSQAYRDAMAERDGLTRWVSALSPAVATQRAMQRLAGTDVAASLGYDERIRAYHADIRRFYYPFVFDESSFDRGELENAPVFVP